MERLILQKQQMMACLAELGKKIDPNQLLLQVPKRITQTSIPTETTLGGSEHTPDTLKKPLYYQSTFRQET